ncbi:alpha/beta hydrolase [Nocardia sp. NPDC051911]|uniref:alpha/beta hydrolase n=1 Tax=Nocardia sp. NPDC051911 TaxID=3154648 RepID=UPI00342E58B2
MESVRFKNKDIDVAADLRFPPGFDSSKKYPAIVCGHPISSCKEQTAGSIYGERLAEMGYVTLAFDASYQGESGGEPRYLEDPAARVEDFRCAVDYLVTLDYVDEERIGALGVCGGGVYAANATMTEHRIKALGTVVAARIPLDRVGPFDDPTYFPPYFPTYNPTYRPRPETNTPPSRQQDR